MSYKDQPMMDISTLDKYFFTSTELSHFSSRVLEEYSVVFNQYITDDQHSAEAKTILCHEWLFGLKECALLLRDSCLNLMKAEAKVKSGSIDEGRLHEYCSEVKSTIENALNHLNQKLRNPPSEDASKYSHSADPSELVLQQLDTIREQIRIIPAKASELETCDLEFRDFIKRYEVYFAQLRNRLDEYQSVIDKAQNLVNTDDLASMIEHKNSIAKAINNLSNEMEGNHFIQDFEAFSYPSRDKLLLPLKGKGSEYMIKSIDVTAEINGWNALHLIPDIKQVDKSLIAFEDKLEAMLFQLHNKVAALEGTEDEYQSDSKLSNIKEFPESIERELNDSLLPFAKTKIQEMRNEMRTHLNLEQFYNEEYDFLPISTISKIAGSASYRSYLPIQRMYLLGSWIKEEKNKLIHRFRKNHLPLETFITEIDTLYNDTTSSFFLKKGFIGSSFISERKDISSKLKQAINNWHAGFGQALFLKGGHGCGKTTILESISHHHPKEAFYLIEEGSRIDINGRIIEVQRNKIKSIEELLKHRGSDKIIIGIDGLENTTDHLEELYLNFDLLQQLILKYAKKVLFIVAGHESFYQRIAPYIKSDDIFSEVIDCSYTPKSLIHSGLKKRVHAIHDQKELDEENEKYEAMIDSATDKSNGNIGLAFLQYEHLLLYGKPIEMSNPHLVKILNDNRELLTLLSFKGRISERSLREMFNQVEIEYFRQSLSILINKKIVQRSDNGTIEINPHLKVLVDQIILNRS